MTVKNTNKKLVFSGRTNLPLAQSIAEILQLKLGEITLESFANGEIYAKYARSIRGYDLFLVQSVCNGIEADSCGLNVNDSLMELCIMADAAKRASASSITAVISHYGYSRQDKKSAAREPITAKLVADMLTVAGVDRIVTIDLHQGQIQGFFDAPVNHLTALPIFANYFIGKNLKDVTVVSPDVGRAKAAKKFTDLMGEDAELAIMHKDRPAHNVSEVTSVIGHVQGRTCIINDDMIDTAGSLVGAAEALQEAGAAAVYACATHGLFSGPGIERIAASDIVEVVVTDSVPIAPQNLQGKIKQISIAPLLAEAINNVHNNLSVSELFDPDFQL